MLPRRCVPASLAFALAASAAHAQKCADLLDVLTIDRGAVAMAFDPGNPADPNDDSLVVYDEFGGSAGRYTLDGTLIDTLALNISSNDIDFDISTQDFVVDGTVIPAGSLYVFNGEQATQLSIYQMRPTLQLLKTAAFPASGTAVGFAIHNARNALYAAFWTNDQIAEFSPSTLANLSQFPVQPAGSPGFDIFYGDMEIAQANGNILAISSSQQVIRELAPDGAWLRDAFIIVDAGQPAAMAVDDARGEVWIGQLNNKLLRFGRIFSEGCVADVNDDTIVDFGDVGAFVFDFSQNDPAADMNCDGVVDFGDVAVFVQAFGAGC
jgi:hypothetical protein